MTFGYAPVSTQDQSLDLQADALEQARRQKLFTEKASSAKTARPWLQTLPGQPRSGDTVVQKPVRGNKGGRKVGLSKRGEQATCLAESLYKDKKLVREVGQRWASSHERHPDTYALEA